MSIHHLRIPHNIPSIHRPPSKKTLHNHCHPFLLGRNLWEQSLYQILGKRGVNKVHYGFHGNGEYNWRQFYRYRQKNEQHKGWWRKISNDERIRSGRTTAWRRGKNSKITTERMATAIWRKSGRHWKHPFISRHYWGYWGISKRLWIRKLHKGFVEVSFILDE